MELPKGTAAKVSLTKPIIPLDVKRFYLPGVVLEATCPLCGKRVANDYSQEYLSYPTANDPFTAHFCHEGPDGNEHEFSVDVVLRITLEVA